MKHSERGSRFEIQCIQETIAGKSGRGEDCGFGRVLLKAWGKHFKDNHQDALGDMCKVKIKVPLAAKR